MIDTIVCPSCRRTLATSGEAHGQEVQCPSCKAQFRVSTLPAPRPTVASPASVAVELPAPGTAPNRPPVRGSADDRPRGPRPRTESRGSARKATGSRRKPMLAVIFVASACILAACCWLGRFTNGPNGWRQAQLPEAPVDWGDQNGITEADIEQEVRPLFQELGDDFRAGAGERIIRHFDPERTVAELRAFGFAEFNAGAKGTEFLKGFRQGMTRSLEKQAPLLAWKDCEIKQVKKLRRLEAVIIARHRHDEGAIAKMRWWVTKRDGTWRIYDMEDLEMGMRISAGASTLLAGGPGQAQRLQEFARATECLREVINSLGVKHDVDAAERKLREIEHVALPRPYEAMRWMLTASIQIQRGQHRDALATLDRAHGFHAEMPILDLLKGMACNGLNERERALVHLKAYEDLLGDDANVCRELGFALHGLNRIDEARAAYRKSLDYNPREIDAFLGLLRTVGAGDACDDLGPRFAKLGNPQASFEECLRDCQQARDAASLTALAQAMRKLDATSSSAQFALALAAAWEKRADPALREFEAALALEPDEGKRAGFTTDFLKAMANGGLALPAYKAAPQSREAFRTLAAELKKVFRTDDLLPLLNAHARKFPDDPLLPFYRGEAQVQRGQYALADKSFTAGMAQPPAAATLDSFRSSRVQARYHVGAGVDAHVTIGPRRETFQQLAMLCLQDHNDGLLETLLEAHARVDPNDPALLRMGCRLRIRTNQLDEAVALFRASLAKEPQEAQRKRAVEDFLFAMVDEGKPVEGYRAAPDAVEAFDLLANEVLDQGRLDELRQLIDVHRAGHPTDVRLAYSSGRLLLNDQKWHEAARLLGEAWRGVPLDQKNILSADYVRALCKSGRSLEAYQAVEPRNNTFVQLAYLLVQERKRAELETLIAAHKQHAPQDADLVFFQARAAVLSQQYAEAMVFLKSAHALQKAQVQRAGYVRNLVLDMNAAGHGLDAYRAAPDKAVAFETLAGQLVLKKNAEELDALLAEHGKDRAKDPWHAFYSGEVALLRGKPALAERSFATAGAPANQRWAFQRALHRAQLQAGKIVEAYRDASAGTHAFDELASLCQQEKNAAQLSALIAEHRKSDPDDSNLVAWDLDLRWLQGDYEGALKLLAAHREDVFRSPRFAFKADSHRVRCLVKLKRTDDAVREAEALLKANRMYGRMLLILAHASAGDAQRAIAAAEQKPAQQFLLEDCYRDPDLGPILRSNALRTFRERFPEPKTPEIDNFR